VTIAAKLKDEVDDVVHDCIIAEFCLG
jgi:hypothetical protein